MRKIADIRTFEDRALLRWISRASALAFGIGVLATAGLAAVLLSVIVLYLAGADSLVCILFGLSSGSLAVWLTFRMNRKFGEHGLMKRLAEKRHPRYLIHRRRLFRLLTKRQKR